MDKETEGERQTDTKRDRHKEGQTKRDRWTQRETDGHRGRYGEKLGNSLMHLEVKADNLFTWRRA